MEESVKNKYRDATSFPEKAHGEREIGERKRKISCGHVGALSSICLGLL